MGDVSEGEDVTLVCSVQRGTPPFSFTWYHADTSLASQTSDKPEAPFKITNVKGEDQGGYYCMSNNPANETQQSQTVIIRGVFYLPPVADCDDVL